MNSVVVNNMEFLGKKQVTTQLQDKRTVDSYDFLVTDVSTMNPKYYLAVALSKPMEEENDLEDLNAMAEVYIVLCMKEEIMSSEKKKLLVIDLSNFPYISSYIDYRDQTIVNLGDESKFGKDVIEAWNGQTSEVIPAIIVNTANMKDTFTALKYVPLC